MIKKNNSNKKNKKRRDEEKKCNTVDVSPAVAAGRGPGFEFALHDLARVARGGGQVGGRGLGRAARVLGAVGHGQPHHARSQVQAARGGRALQRHAAPRHAVCNGGMVVMMVVMMMIIMVMMVVMVMMMVKKCKCAEFVVPFH